MSGLIRTERPCMSETSVNLDGHIVLAFCSRPAGHAADEHGDWQVDSDA